MYKKKLFLSSIATFVLLSFSLVVSVEAQSPTMWTQTYGGTGGDIAYSLVETSDGGYAIAGYTFSFGAGGADFWLVNTDESGNVEWNRTYGGTEWEFARSLVETSDGGYAIAGYTRSFGAGWDDFWLVKTDEFGNMEWNRTYGGTEWEWGYSLVETSDGGYALAGGKSPFIVAPTSFWLVKTDEFGNMEWNRTYEDEGRIGARSLVETSDGGYALAGGTSSFGAGESDFWLIKTDANGNMEWNQTYGETESEWAYSLVDTSDGGYAIAGYTQSFGTEKWNLWFVKTDEFGNMEWNRTYGGIGRELISSLVETSDGGYAIAASTNSFGAGESDFWLIKTDANGNMEWNQTYGGEHYEDAYSLVETSDGGYAIAGSTNSSGTEAHDFWLIKTNELGIVPECFSLMISSLLLTATLVILIIKKRLFNPTS